MTKHGRHGKRKAFVAVASLFLAPALIYLLEARARRRAATRPERGEAVARPVTPAIAAPPASEQEPTWDVPALPVLAAPAEPLPAPGEDERPATPRAVVPEVRPRATRVRLWLVALAAVIVVVVPTSLYVALSSFSLPSTPWDSTPRTRSAAEGRAAATNLITRGSSGAKVVSYYPSTAGWSYMWTRYDGERIAADFDRAHALGFDTVRIFVPPAAFGYPRPSALMLGRLRNVIAAASAAKLRVGLALFDRFEHYGDRGASAIWLRAVLAPRATDTRIAFVEVHNEINPTNAQAISWLVAMTRVARRIAPRIPLVASVAGGSGVAGVRMLAKALAPARPDIYSLHYYANPGLLGSTLRSAQAAVAPVPLILGEVGYSTAAGNRAAEGAPATTWAQEAQQSLVLRSAFETTRRLALPAPGIWALYDFEPGAFPPDIAPHHRSELQAFGLIRTDGTTKPAASDVHDFLTKSAISTDINADFSRGGPSPTGPQPGDWRAFDRSEGSLLWDSAVGHDAPGSVRLSATKGSSKRVPAFFQQIWSVPIRPHQDFRVSVWARGSLVAGDDRVAISWFDADGKYLGEKQSVPLPHGNTDWTKLAVHSRPPARAASVEVHLKSAHESGRVWFDDVVIE